MFTGLATKKSSTHSTAVSATFNGFREKTGFPSCKAKAPDFLYIVTTSKNNSKPVWLRKTSKSQATPGRRIVLTWFITITKITATHNGNYVNLPASKTVRLISGNAITCVNTTLLPDYIPGWPGGIWLLHLWISVQTEKNCYSQQAGRNTLNTHSANKAYIW